VQKFRTLRTVSLLALVAASVISWAQATPPAWSSAATYNVGDQVQLNGNVLRAVKAITPRGFAYADWELWDVRSNTTVMVGVGQTFATLTSAVAYAQNCRIADGAYLHIYISTALGKFLENLTAPINLDHAFGSSISILGDNAANITLSANFINANLFTIDGGHKFNTISNLSLTTSMLATALYATQKSSVANITGLVITGFYDGFRADTGAFLNVAANIKFSGGNETYFVAGNKAVIIVGNGFTGSDGALWGFYTFSAGFIQAESANVSNAVNYGAQASYGGSLDVSGGTFTNCHWGIDADLISRVVAEDCTIMGSMYHDVEADHGSTVDAAGGSHPNEETSAGGQIY
jgi:hypothetical protein